MGHRKWIYKRSWITISFILNGNCAGVCRHRLASSWLRLSCGHSNEKLIPSLSPATCPAWFIFAYKRSNRSSRLPFLFACKMGFRGGEFYYGARWALEIAGNVLSTASQVISLNGCPLSSYSICTDEFFGGWNWVTLPEIRQRQSTVTTWQFGCGVTLPSCSHHE